MLAIAPDRLVSQWRRPGVAWCAGERAGQLEWAALALLAEAEGRPPALANAPAWEAVVRACARRAGAPQSACGPGRRCCGASCRRTISTQTGERVPSDREATLAGVPDELETELRAASHRLVDAGMDGDAAWDRAQVEAGGLWLAEQYEQASRTRDPDRTVIVPEALMHVPFSADYDRQARAGAPAYRTPFAEVEAPEWLNVALLPLIAAIYTRWRDQRCGPAECATGDPDPELVYVSESELRRLATGHGRAGGATQLRELLRQATVPITAAAPSGGRSAKRSARPRGRRASSAPAYRA